MRRRITLLIACTAIVALVAAMFLPSSESGDAEASVAETAAVLNQPLTDDISLSGTLEPLTRTITHRAESGEVGVTSNLLSGDTLVQPLSSAVPQRTTLIQAADDDTATSTTEPPTPDTTGPPTPDTTAPPTTSTTGPPTTTPPTTAVPTTTPPTTTRPEPPTTTTTEGDEAAQGGGARPANQADTTQQPGTAGSTAAPTSPSAYVTELPAVGDVIAPGDAVYSVDGVVVQLLPGSAPAWRTLESGLSGPDVAQLETYLAETGYDPGTVDDTFTATTSTAVSSWQNDHDLPETGSVELGTVIFAPGAVTVTAVHVSVGDAIADGESVLDVAGSDLQATLSVDADLVRLVVPGQEFEISVGGDQSVGAIIASVVANPRGGATAIASLSEQPDVPVVPIDVTARRSSLSTDAELTVPATALIKLDRGGYAVRLDSGSLVTVEILAASGSTVAVGSTDLHADDLVRVG